jgi:beta-lactamase regulating signal transducer with metallopeptidase domain
MAGIALEAVDGASGRLVMLVLLHSLWISLVVASHVALVFPMCPRLSHQTRHLILLVALLLVAMGPVIAAPVHRALSRGSERVMEEDAIAKEYSRVVPMDTPRAPSPNPVSTASAGSLRKTPVMSTPLVVISRSLIAIHCVQRSLLIAWFVGFGTLAGILALGARGVSRIVREAQAAPQAVERRAAVLARRARLKKPPRVMVHARLCEPCLGGLFRPVILLPEEWLAKCPTELLDAMLAHELAHAQRLDHVVNLLQR